MNAASRRRSGTTLLGPAEMVALGAFACVLLPGLALATIAPNAWPIPVLAAFGALAVMARAAVANRAAQDAVAAEAASGVTAIEAWLSDRDRA